MRHARSSINCSRASRTNPDSSETLIETRLEERGGGEEALDRVVESVGVRHGGERRHVGADLRLELVEVEVLRLFDAPAEKRPIGLSRAKRRREMLERADDRMRPRVEPAQVIAE